MSGYRSSPFGGGSTGPMQTNDQIMKLTPVFKFCNDCNQDTDPGGGVQMRPGHWSCAKCWRIRMRGGKPKKAA